ncbi:hypothetical protein FGO68_gene4616 [Halteria grandinella]|uniref:Uncharacterized protein n=1 Tax=Halteria grandinella TaxID=5974 RepID=A0A8J8T1L8_HALGN|nr:hypothetical protein FGO68_gene4616 [Halteria grandinella]
MEGIYAHADLLKVYKAILDSTQEIAVYLRYHSGPFRPPPPSACCPTQPRGCGTLHFPQVHPSHNPYSSTNQCLQSTSCPSRTSSARRSPTST